MVKLVIDGDTLARTAAYAIDKETNEKKRYRLVKTITEATLGGWVDYLKQFFTISKGTEIYLTARDKSQFRYKIDPNYHYKRWHSEEPPPSMMWHCREYLQKHHMAVHGDKVEADDMLSIRAFEEKPGKVVVVGNDKDFRLIDNQTYLWNLDWGLRPYQINYPGVLSLFKMRGKGIFVWGTSIRWFYFQLMYGDPADEIKGTGLSQLECFKILHNAKLEDMETLCLKEYLRAHKTKHDMIKVANLLWLKRTRNKTEPFPLGMTIIV